MKSLLPFILALIVYQCVGQERKYYKLEGEMNGAIQVVCDSMFHVPQDSTKGKWYLANVDCHHYDINGICQEQVYGVIGPEINKDSLIIKRDTNKNVILDEHYKNGVCVTKDEMTYTYDKMGNWIKLILRRDGHPIQKEIRIITYY